MLRRRTFFTTRQAAKILNVCVRTVQLWCDSGRLKGWVSPGGHRRIASDSVLSLLNETMDHGSSPNARKTKHVLVVEDDEDLVRLYRMNFARWDFPLEEHYANDGFLGLVEIGRHSPDLLITDLFMPNLDGLKMMESLNRGGLYIPTIVVTGGTKADIQSIMNVDEDLLVLSKPIDFGLLRRLISTMLDIKKPSAATNGKSQ